MLSLFRHATRRSLFAARPAFVAHYSADHSPDVDMAPMEELQGILETESESSRGFGGDSEMASRSLYAVQWKPFEDGYVVKPHDFTFKARVISPRKYQTRRAQQGPPSSVARHDDVFYQNDIDPLDLAMNPNILSHYVSEMGKIYGRNITGLTSKSQRRVGKAIRRAKMMGIIPILTKSPFYFKSR